MADHSWLYQGELQIRFDTFVERALFHLEHGYYSCNISQVGQRGDFSTSATLSSLLARGIYDWIVKRPKRLPVIEVGAGSGQLASAILAQQPASSKLAQAMSQRLPLFGGSAIDYHIVEASEVLRDQQRERLGKQVTWHDSLHAALESLDGAALIFSNELVDAFPPRVFQKTETGWNELWIRSDRSEHWLKACQLPESSVFSRNWKLGQRVEVHDSYHNWLSKNLKAFTEGEILTIDYGETVDQLYHRQPTGSVRAFLHHQLLDGPQVYQNPGRQDITCDVNFTDLINWGRELGLETKSLQTQSDFLKPFSKGTTVDHYLLHNDGAGGVFKALTSDKF